MEAQYHGWLWVICTDEQWVLKQEIATVVVPPVEPGPYTGNSSALKFIYKQKIEHNEEYDELKGNTIKAITEYFDQDLLIELKNEAEIIEYTLCWRFTHTHQQQLPATVRQKSGNLENTSTTQDTL